MAQCPDLRRPWWGGLDSLPQCSPQHCAGHDSPDGPEPSIPSLRPRGADSAASGLQFYPQTSCVTLGEPGTLSEPCSLCNGDGLLVTVERGDEIDRLAPADSQPPAAIFMASPIGPGGQEYPHPQTLDGSTSPCLGPATHLKLPSILMGRGLELEKEMTERAG